MNYINAYTALNDSLEMEPGRLGDIWETARINGADTRIESGGDEHESAVRTFFDILDGEGLHIEHDKYMVIAKNFS